MWFRAVLHNVKEVLQPLPYENKVPGRQTPYQFRGREGWEKKVEDHWVQCTEPQLIGRVENTGRQKVEIEHNGRRCHGKEEYLKEIQKCRNIQKYRSGVDKRNGGSRQKGGVK